jgi:hypothetical protein
MPLVAAIAFVLVAAVGVLFVRNLISHPAEVPVDPLPPEYRPRLPRLWVVVVVALSAGLFASPALAVFDKALAVGAVLALAVALCFAAQPLIRARREQVRAIGADLRARAAWMERAELEQLVSDLQRRWGSVMRPLGRLVPLAEPPELASQPHVVEDLLRLRRSPRPPRRV